MKSEKLKGVSLLLIGICLFGVGFYFLRNQLKFISNSVETSGVVEELSSHLSKGSTYYSPIVAYTVDGQSYRIVGKVSSSLSSSYEIGETVNVRYEKNDPTSAELVSFSDMWLMTSIMSGLGVLFCSIGVYEILTNMHKQKMRTQLPRTGKKLQLVGRMDARQNKNRTEFFVVADWLNPSDGKMITFRSDKIKYDPTQFVKDKELIVWIDPQNPKKNHYIDISFLPEGS